MTIFFSSFHMLQAFLNLVWNSFLWILAFHIYHVILCGKVPLIIVPGVFRICRLWLARKGVFDGKDPSACNGMRFSSSGMVVFLSDGLKFEDWHEWFYFLFSLYIFESIIYLTCCLTIQMFLIFHLLIAQLWTFCVAFELPILKSTMCLWMGIFMRENLFRQLLQEFMGLSITAYEHSWYFSGIHSFQVSLFGRLLARSYIVILWLIWGECFCCLDSFQFKV